MSTLSHLGHGFQKPSLASGITLQPMKMAEHIQASSTGSQGQPRVGYLPPHLRNPDASKGVVNTQPTKATVTDTEFPTLGVMTKKASAGKINFKKAVDDHLEREKLADAGRSLESDERFDDSADLNNWVSLSLKGSLDAAADGHIEPYDSLAFDFDLDFGEFPSKTIVQEMEEEADRVFRSYLNEKQEDQVYLPTTRLRRLPLNEACIRYRQSLKAKTNL
jgi:hypothetical protein